MRLVVTNTQAYYETTKITTVKSFEARVPGLRMASGAKKFYDDVFNFSHFL
jgi:hypothetical protein